MDDGDEPDRLDASDALVTELSSVEGEPACALCGGTADFFLFEPDRVAKFVCWEHVSPVSADVAADLEDSDRPIAVPLSEEFS
ncbi:MAG: hypothetical protein ABEJ58_09155 [Halodesulfurarchaeum sp.]